MDKLASMQVFVTVIQRGSLSAAAEQLDLSAAMVGKHIQRLEAYLGTRLLLRTTRRQSLTESGHTFYNQCQHILAAVEAAEQAAMSAQEVPRGLLRISAPPSFGSLVLPLAIADFLQTHPEVSVELSVSEKMVDLVSDGFDFAIRAGKLQDSAMVARYLCPYRMLICATPDYLANNGTPQTPDELGTHQCLGFSWGGAGNTWTLSGLADGLIVNTRFRSNNNQALLTVALAGLGLVMQPEVLLQEEVKQGRLISVLTPYLPQPQDVHLLYLPDRARTAKSRSFIAFMKQRFADYAE